MSLPPSTAQLHSIVTSSAFRTLKSLREHVENQSDGERRKPRRNGPVRRKSDKGIGYLRTATFQPFSFGPFLQTITTIRMERVSRQHLKNLCWNTQGQDVAEYAIMLAVVLVIVMGMVRMIGTNASTVFSQVASGIQ